MAMAELGEWSQEWAILFAIHANSGYIPGKVRLMKYVSVLQRDGFPVANRFINAEMGPYDEEVHRSALALQSYGLLQIDKIDSGKEKRRVDYRVTEFGVEAFRKLILPLLGKLPHQSQLAKQFRITRTQFRFRKTRDILEKLHRELHLDDEKDFVRSLGSTLAQIRDLASQLKHRYLDSCPVCLRLLGTVDFAQRALEEILGTRVSDPYSGKNHILYNAERLIPMVTELTDHEHVEDPRTAADTPLHAQLREIEYLLHCIELNCDIYGVLRPVETTGSDFEELALI